MNALLYNGNRVATDAFGGASAARPGVLTAALQRVRAAIDERRTVAALSNLTDRQLWDIGVERDEIETVAARCSREYFIG